MQVTHCPECATAFKVTPEQLQLAGGWVRCGRCGAVFEALKNLQPVEQAAAQKTPEAKTPPQRQAPAPVQTAVTPPQTLNQSAAEPMLSPDWLDQDVRFAQDAPTTTASPRQSVLWVVASGVLAVLMLIQGVLHKRDWLMAQEPALGGLLSVLCAPVGCVPQWPRLPESLQIDSSAFTRNSQDFYSVQVRIKNTEHFALAPPHVELSLLDIYDDVVLRKVFSPQELKLGASIAPLRDARVAVDFDLQEPIAARVTGYRIFLFYP